MFMKELSTNTVWSLLFLIFLSFSSFAQEVALTSLSPTQANTDEKVVSLEKALSLLSEKHGVIFTYLKEVVAPYQVGVDISHLSNLEGSLRLILADTPLQYRKVSQLNYLIFDRRKEEQQKRLSQRDFLEPKSAGNRPAPVLTTLPQLDVSPNQPKSSKFILEGRVLNEQGQPLIGVNITVKQAQFQGTTTDVNGNYQLALKDGQQTLICSYIGYQPREVIVQDNPNLNITMRPQAAVLSEVVVVGYGQQQKQDVMGAISSVKAEDLQRIQSTSPDQQLQAWASGVLVQSASGLPGAPVRVLIRGTNSLFSGTEPLWIIDGMILSRQGGGELNGFSRNASTSPLNPLALLNPNDIASIEILKDAAATAVYGSRGANGVIIITTKSGEKEGSSLRFSMSYGITDMLRGPADLGFVDGPTWLTLADEARLNSGLSNFDPNSLLDNSRDPTAVLDRAQIGHTDWFDQILRQGGVKEVNLSGNESRDKWNLYWSGNYRDEQSVLKNDNFERFAFRTNMDMQVTPSLSIDSRVSLSYVRRQRAPNGGEPGGNTNMGNGGYNMAQSRSLPIFPVYHPTASSIAGEPLLFDPLSGRNLAATFDRNNYINDINTYRALAGLQFRWEVPGVKGLSVKSDLAADLIQTNNLEWGNTVIREQSAYGFDFSSTFHRFNYNLYASFDRSIGDQHYLNLVVGTESTAQASRGRNLEAQGSIRTPQEISEASDVLRASAGLGNERYFRGYFSRLNYRLSDRYLLGVSFRRDGSSIFKKDSRWGNFVALSGGWILSEETFMPKWKALDFLKLKGSFGQTGNSAINSLATETTYTGWGRYGEVGAGDLLTGIGNEGITWETTDSRDIGVEASLYDGNLTGNLGYYFQHTSDMLYRVPVPVSTGVFTSAPTIWQNIGDLRNQGWELELKGLLTSSKDFSWRTGLNFSTNINRVTRLTGETTEIYNVQRSALVSRVGDRIGFFRLARYAGIHPEGGYELIEEMDLERFQSTGARVPTGRLIPASRENLATHLFDFTNKSGLPSWFGGLSNTITYKNWQLFVLLSFSGGNYIYDRAERDASGVHGPNQIRQQIVGNTWTAEYPQAAFPALRWDSRYDIVLEDGSIMEGERFDRRHTGHTHDKYLYSGDYLRIRSLSLQYTLPNRWSSQLRMQQIRIGLLANNLLTITGYRGIDPEFVNMEGNRNLGQGWNGIQLPQVRSFFFNLDIDF